MKKYLSDRRSFLEFLGLSTVVLSERGFASSSVPFFHKNKVASLPAHDKDSLKLAKGLKSEVLIRWDDDISESSKFGISNDFVAFFSDKTLNTGDEGNGYLWVNHEFPMPRLQDKGRGLREDVIRQQKSLGGTILKIKKRANGVTWDFVKRHPHNRRIDATTQIPFAAEVAVAGTKVAVGTFANCSGGQTSWGTFLSCEENYDHFYGEVDYRSKSRRLIKGGKFGWQKYYDFPPEHYGWVVEINPLNGDAKKLTALGRFAHEGSLHVVAGDGRSVVYMGDDKHGGCIYKFISSQAGSLDRGELYVADLDKGKWLSLNWHKNSVLQKTFKNSIDCLVHSRLAANLVGGTPCDRPEGIAINPIDQSINICLTGDGAPGNVFGSILKIHEKDQDYASGRFVSQTYLSGGSKKGFANPDNIQFDSRGNLWFTTDVGDSKLNKGEYKLYGNNSLYVVPSLGSQAGEVIRVASGPIECELTGICFDEQEKCLFLSVQHPGSKSKSRKNTTSNWPDGGDSLPRSAVVMLYGDLLKELVSS